MPYCPIYLHRMFKNHVTIDDIADEIQYKVNDVLPLKSLLMAILNARNGADNIASAAYECRDVDGISGMIYRTLTEAERREREERI